MTMCRYSYSLSALAMGMVGFALYAEFAFNKGFADVALGLSAGLVVAGCALAVYCFRKKESSK